MLAPGPGKSVSGRTKLVRVTVTVRCVGFVRSQDSRLPIHVSEVSITTRSAARAAASSHWQEIVKLGNSMIDILEI